MFRTNYSSQWPGFSFSKR